MAIDDKIPSGFAISFKLFEQNIRSDDVRSVFCSLELKSIFNFLPIFAYHTHKDCDSLCFGFPGARRC